MAKFIYITDTHFGEDNPEFFEQPIYTGALKELAGLLNKRIEQDPEIRFVLHGGDMIDHLSEDAIRSARDVFRFSVPVYLCLGNHDLTGKDALEKWIKTAPEFFPGEAPVFSINIEAGFLHVCPNQWCDIPYYWEREQKQYFLREQLVEVGKAVRRHPDLLHIFCTHSDFFGVPPDQTGFEQAYHAPLASFTQQMKSFLAEYPQVRYVLGGHTHVNTHIEAGGVHYITASAFAEAPFEYKVFEVQAGRLSMHTLNLLSETSFMAEYNFDKSYVQGRPKDRRIES